MSKTCLGPWATSFDSSPRAQLSRLWRQRVLSLPHSAAHSRPIRQSGRVALTVLALIAIAAPGFEGRPVPAAAQPATETPATAPAPASEEKNSPAAGKPIRVELPGGAIAEVVAVGPHPSTDQAWWAPDGRPTAAPYAKLDNRCGPDTNEFVREIAIRWVVEPKDQTLSSMILGGGSSGSGKPRDANGKTIADLTGVAHAFKKGTKTCDVRFSVASSDWATVATTDGRSDFSWGDSKYSVAFTKASLRSEGLAMSMAHNITAQNVRIVAIDREGNLLKAPYCTGGGGRGFMQTTAAFPNLELEDVKEFRLERRPYQQVEVRNISLDANELTRPEVVALPDVRDQAQEWSLGENFNRKKSRPLGGGERY